MDDFYLTISNPAKVETKVKGSGFIAEAVSVESSEKALEILKEIRKKEHAASHHCYAYRIGFGAEQEFKYSDDGEPSGSAGKPIFDCIAGRNLNNVIVVVTRYFGGTKLGTGGLVRAYGNAAIAALEKAGTKTVYLTDSIKVALDFKYYDQMQKILQAFEAAADNSEFGELVKLTLSVRKSKTEQLKNEIMNLTHGRAKIE